MGSTIFGQNGPKIAQKGDFWPIFGHFSLFLREVSDLSKKNRPSGDFSLPFPLEMGFAGARRGRPQRSDAFSFFWELLVQFWS